MRIGTTHSLGPRAAALAGAWLWLAVAVAHGSGLPGLSARPPNPGCVAFERPANGPNITLDLSQVFGQTFTYGVTLIPSPVDPLVWYLQLRGADHKPEELGIIFTLTDNQDGSFSTTEFLNIQGQVACCGEYGMLGMALHPDFATNGHVFVLYTRPTEAGDPPSTVFVSRLSRFTLFAGGDTLDPASESVLLEVPQENVFHQGGRILFGPDGYLYVTLGEDTRKDEAQDPATLLGSILRIDVDGGSPYAIPPDNPFALGGGAPEIWAYGLRNPWGLRFDSLTGDLYATDVGQNRFEEVNQIVAGANYGWPILEGHECRQPPCGDISAFTPPLVAHLHADEGGDARAMTGVVMYRGSLFPELYGRLVYADLNGNIFTLWSEGGTPAQPLLLFTDPFPILGISEGPSGELYLLNTTRVKQVLAGPPPLEPLPQLLSETGCFDPQDPTQPLPALVPYGVRVELWSDGATKDRWVALPDGEQITVPPDGDWDLPIGAVLAKNFTLDGLLVETRLLMRHDDGGWAGYSYEWDDPPTDATLLEDGKTRDVGGQTWTYPSRVQCLECHTDVAGRTLGPRTEQLNGDFFYPSTGLTANQIETLDFIGFLTPSPGDPAGLPALPAIDDGSASLHERALGYLQTNCAHCHQAEGPTQVMIDLRASATPQDAMLCDVVPLEGDLGVPNARILTPFDAATSVLALRMHDTGVFRMPPLATELVHAEATTLVDAWIATSDDDADGVHSACDNCPFDPNVGQQDGDGDGFGDACDSCPLLANAEQADHDQDGAGNPCDDDDDNDGLDDVYETGTGVYVSPTETGTDPYDWDTDGDLFADGAEVAAGFDPTDPDSHPGTDPIPLLPGGVAPVLAGLLLGAGVGVLRARQGRRRVGPG